MSDTATIAEKKVAETRAGAANIIDLQGRIGDASARDAAVQTPCWVNNVKPEKQNMKAGGYSTVRSGYAYDFDSKKSTALIDAIRAANLKARVADAQLTGIQSRLGYRFAKRTFDIVFSVVVLVLFSWLFLIIAAAIKADDPKGPVFFKQNRVSGKGEFVMYKFRSMCVDAEERLPELRALNEKTGPVFKIAEDPRITRVGKWLRKLSLDELLQFVNVLKGDMSIVGPRPALPNEVATYSDHQRKRLLVKPGITCYWQTRRNRDAITFDEWIDLDLLYVKQCSAWADIKLIIQTVGVVLTAQGS